MQWANFTTTFATAIVSKTGPAVSSGSGTQAFQFAKKNYIAYADGLLESWKKNGLYDDFLPGVLGTMKTGQGYVAVPYNLDMRVLWYRKSLLEKAGVNPPTDWQSYLDACAALKKIGVFGFGIASGAQGNGFQALVGLLINNGGGLFNAEQKPDCVTPANIEALDFVVELVRKGYMDPGSVSYSTTNAQSQWKAGKFGMGFEGPGPRPGPRRRCSSRHGSRRPAYGRAGRQGRPLLPEQHHDVPQHAEPEGLRGVPDLLLPEHGAALDEEDRHRPAGAQVDRGDPGVPVRSQRGHGDREMAADLQDLGRSRWRRAVRERLPCRQHAGDDHLRAERPVFAKSSTATRAQ